MKNAEKFKEIFGFGVCCMTECKNCPHRNGDDDEAFCEEVKFWESEYKGVDIWNEIIKDIDDEIETFEMELNDAEEYDTRQMYANHLHGLHEAKEIIKKHLGEVNNE